jgi:multiple antibiotic resistance protein
MNWPEIISTAVTLFLAWLTSTILLMLSPRVLSVIGELGSRALERLMGMILVILAIQMLLNGIRESCRASDFQARFCLHWALN